MAPVIHEDPDNDLVKVSPPSYAQQVDDVTAKVKQEMPEKEPVAEEKGKRAEDVKGMIDEASKRVKEQSQRSVIGPLWARADAKIAEGGDAVCNRT